MPDKKMKKVKIGNVTVMVADASTDGAVDVRSQESWIPHAMKNLKKKSGSSK